jgi:hypothetical protein
MYIDEIMPNRLNNDFELRDAGYSNYEDTVNLARHRWYYYKEGFSPFLVDKAIEKVCTNENDIVIDPFNGSGTTTLAASAKGFKSVGIEVNPFTSFLSDAKQKNTGADSIDYWSERVLSSTNKTATSDLIGFSTFSKTKGAEKWLFNNSVLNAFEAGWQATDKIDSYHTKRLLRLSLIIGAMDNCNATRDGKCLRYRLSWKEKKYNKESFQNSVEEIIKVIKQDVENQPLSVKADIINGDARKILKERELEKFKLCVTSPPYLNTFDYTDIYRPELFLGKFVETNQQLYNIRLTTVRSHIQAQWESPTFNDFGMLYQQAMCHLQANPDKLMDKNILKMVQAYFEDMLSILRLLKSKAAKDAELWLVVSNSAYANRELPVDLILGDIGTQAGWFLKEIGVLRHIQRRKTKHSPDVLDLRESVIIFQANKK